MNEEKELALEARIRELEQEVRDLAAALRLLVEKDARAAAFQARMEEISIKYTDGSPTR